jgi:hypothetical protein
MGISSTSDLIKSEEVQSDVISDKGFENFTAAVTRLQSRSKKKIKPMPIVLSIVPDLTPIPEKKE